MLRQNEPHEPTEPMANHGPLCKRINSDEETSSNQPCGKDSEYIIGAFLKSFSIGPDFPVLADEQKVILYLLLEGVEGRTEGRTAEYYVLLLFSKRWGTKVFCLTL